MVYSREQLMTALRNADAAGDTEEARRTAQMLSPGDQSTQNQSQPGEQSLVGKTTDWLTGGQSAGQIAEQAGRGLVNIPFDVLQDGASLANVISQGLGGPKVLDDVYRPVNRPIDSYAQAGETIGEHLVPGVGAAGSTAIGSLAEAANQKGDLAQNATKNAGANLAIQGVLLAAVKGIRCGIAAIKGDIAPEAAKKIATSESMGVIPMTSGVIPSKNAFTRGLTRDAEEVLFGTGSKRTERYATRSKLVSNYFDRFGGYNPDDVVKSPTATLRGQKDAAGAVINDVTNKMGNATVDTTSTMNALNTAIARQERLGTSANQSLLTFLRNLHEELASPATDLDATFDLLRQHRTAFRSNVQGDATVFPNQTRAVTNMIENAMSKDPRSTAAKNLGASDATKYLKVNSDHANVCNKVLNKSIANKLNKASSEASSRLMNTAVLSRKPSDVKRIWSALDGKGKDVMRAAYASKIAEKAGDSPAKFTTEVNKPKSQSSGEIYDTIFPGKHMKEFDVLHEVLQQTARSDTANVVTQTRQSQANGMRTIGAIATLGVPMGLEVGPGAMMHLHESRAARNTLFRLVNTKVGIPAYERVINNAANAIRPLFATEVTQQ